MVSLVILGCFMVGINIMFSYLELLPYIDAAKKDIHDVTTSTNPFIQVFRYIMLPFKLLSHIGLLLPTLIDLGAMYFLSTMFSLGNSMAGGLTGLFASNFVSVIVFCNTHKLSFWGVIKYILAFLFSGFKVPNHI